MPSPEQIREGIVAAAQKRDDGDRLASDGRRELVAWLRAAQAADGVTMTEAATLARVNRVTLYELLERG